MPAGIAHLAVTYPCYPSRLLERLGPAGVPRISHLGNLDLLDLLALPKRIGLRPPTPSFPRKQWKGGSHVWFHH